MFALIIQYCIVIHIYVYNFQYIFSLLSAEDSSYSIYLGKAQIKIWNNLIHIYLYTYVFILYV